MATSQARHKYLTDSASCLLAFEGEIERLLRATDDATRAVAYLVAFTDCCITSAQLPGIQEKNINDFTALVKVSLSENCQRLRALLTTDLSSGDHFQRVSDQLRDQISLIEQKLFSAAVGSWNGADIRHYLLLELRRRIAKFWARGAAAMPFNGALLDWTKPVEAQIDTELAAKLLYERARFEAAIKILAGSAAARALA